MNFEGFKDLIQRVGMEWYAKAKREITDIEAVDAYLAVNPFSAQQTSDNEDAYEKLMDCRMKLYVSELFLIFFGKSKLSETKIVKPQRFHDFFFTIKKFPNFSREIKSVNNKKAQNRNVFTIFFRIKNSQFILEK